MTSRRWRAAMRWKHRLLQARRWDLNIVILDQILRDPASPMELAHGYKTLLEYEAQYWAWQYPIRQRRAKRQRPMKPRPVT